MRKNILMVYPEFPRTYWGMQYANDLTGRKAIMPPLGLITIAALTPEHYDIRLVDANCEALRQSDIDWADMICLSAMIPQKHSTRRIADRGRDAGKLVVLGGPYPSSCPEECAAFSDVLVLDEGEITWNRFIEDLEAGKHQPIYRSEEKPDITLSPTPRFDLLNPAHYAVMPLQFSRGCPFLCEFCDIIVLFGRVPRAKTAAQLLAELDAIHATGHRGAVFIVDDNFIGNKKAVRAVLPSLQEWNEAHGHPFTFRTEASLNLANDDDLLRGMMAAGFRRVFIGIETPSIEGLKETRKNQNLRGSLLGQVRKIQEVGLFVSGGFIVGFDTDGPDIFDRQIEFITRAAIPQAMIGPLTALPGTPLYKRLEESGRLLPEEVTERDVGGSQGFMNVDTVMPRKVFLEGYRRMVAALYQPSAYFHRAVEHLRRLPDQVSGLRRVKASLRALRWVTALYLCACWGIDVPKLTRWAKKRGNAYSILIRMTPEYRRSALMAAFRTALVCPRQLGELQKHWVAGYHFSRFTFEDVVPELSSMLEGMDLASSRTKLPRTADRDSAAESGRARGGAAGAGQSVTPPAA